MKAYTEAELNEIREDAEKARLFRDFSTSPIWKKHMEPFLFKLQTDAEAQALAAFRVSQPNDQILVTGARASGRAEATEEFVKFILRGINDAKESEAKLRELEAAAKKKDGGAK